ncbi:MAG: PAS domain S-box protein [Prolixibacteraceae bacterium]
MKWLNRQRSFIAVLFFLLVLLVVIGGYLINRNSQRELKQGVQNELQTIAQLKIDQISEWYINELSDGLGIAQNSVLIKNIEDWMQRDDTLTDKILLLQLNNLLLEHSLSEIFLITSDYQIRFSATGLTYPLDLEVKQAADKCIVEKTSVSSGLYLCNHHNEIHLDFLAPVYGRNGALLGIMVFVIDANEFLYPFIQKWPVPSKTAETLILRREGDQIVFLNELRHLPGSALSLRIPVSSDEITSVQAGMGYSGIVEGIDYRKVKVIAYVDKIPGTPWFFVAKIDKAELYEKIDLTNNRSLIMVLILVIMVFLAFAFLFSQSQKSSLKLLLESQKEFKTILYSIGDAVITTDNIGLVRNMNSVAELLTGWKENEAIDKHIEVVFNIVNEQSRERLVNPVKKVLSEGVIASLANHTLLIAKDGKEIPISDSGAPILNENGAISGVILVFRDQSEEREHLLVIEEQRRQLFTLMSNLPGMAYRCKNDESWTMEFLSKGCLDLTGYDVLDLVGNKTLSFADLIVAEYRKSVWEKTQEALDAKHPFELEYQIQTRDKKLIWVWEKGQGVYDENNNLIAIEGFISDINDRKNVEAALMESERQFETIAENSTVGIFKTDKYGSTIYVNPIWCEISGLSASDAFENGWLNHVHPADREQLVASWDTNRANNRISNAEYRFLHENGEVVYVKGQAVPEFDAQNELIGYIGNITDVTDLKETSERLKSTNLLLRTLIDNIPDAIYIKDIDGKKILANKADLINIGAEKEEDVIGKTDFDVFPKKIARQFWESDLQVMKKGEIMINHEEELINEKKQAKWLTTSKIPYRNSEGQIIGLIGIGHDITQRKKDEEEKLKLLTILTQSPVSIVITNTDGEIEYVNPKFTEISGYSLSEVLGQNPRILKSGEQPVEFYKKMWAAISTGNEFKGEFHNKKKNGELYWENAIIAPIANKRGVIINYVAVKEDITGKKELMEELIYAKNKAEESDRLKTSFLANMSHEIRTPLNSILGFTSILTESDELSNDVQEKYHTIIKKSSDSLLQIINDIIDISSLETGQLTIKRSNIQLNELLDLLYMEFSKRLLTLRLPDLQLRILDHPASLTIFTDKNRLNQILINLLSNSLKFTQKGYIEFGIEKYDDQSIYFKVEDTGIGIPDELQDAVFERFRQVDSKTERQFGGNGLGLSIVRNLIELMGGAISLESKEGKGSIFRFHLPNIRI